MPSFTKVSSPPPRCDAWRSWRMKEKPGKAGVGSLEVNFVSWIRQVLIFSSWSRCLSSWTLVESPSACHWRMRRADWLTRLAGSKTNLLVCNGPCRSCGGVDVQRLQIQLFLARATAAASLVSPEQERWNAVWQLLQVRGLILQAMLRLQFPQGRRAGWFGSCCCI